MNLARLQRDPTVPRELLERALDRRGRLRCVGQGEECEAPLVLPHHHNHLIWGLCFSHGAVWRPAWTLICGPSDPTRCKAFRAVGFPDWLRHYADLALSAPQEAYLNSLLGFANCRRFIARCDR